MVLLLHFLVMAAALLCLSGLDEVRHSLEYLISPPEVLLYEVLTVNLQEPVVQLVLFCTPMPF